MTVQITRVTKTDPALITALSQLLPQLAPGNPLPTPAQLDEILTNPNVYLLVAHNMHNSIIGNIAGTLTLITYRTITGQHAWIEDVVVDTNARGQGIGEALCQEGIAIARAVGAPSVNLTSRPARVAANRLYQRLGFVQRQTNLYYYALDALHE